MFGMTTTAQQFGSMVGPVFAKYSIHLHIGISYVFSITGLLLLYMASNLENYLQARIML